MHPEIPAALLKHRFSASMPVYTVFASPTAAESSENMMQDLMRQSGLPAWFIHSGDVLAERLRGCP
jgi:hypothetical protein